MIRPLESARRCSGFSLIFMMVGLSCEACYMFFLPIDSVKAASVRPSRGLGGLSFFRWAASGRGAKCVCRGEALC